MQQQGEQNQARSAYFRRNFDQPAWYKRLAVHLLMFLLRMLPGAVKRALAGRMAARQVRKQGRRQQIIDVNLRTCFPGMSEDKRALRKLHFAEKLFTAALDVAHFWKGPRPALDRLVRIEGREHLDSALGKGSGAILLVPHTTSLEIGGLSLARRYPMLGLTSEPKQDIEHWAFKRIREQFSDAVLDRTASVRRVIRELRGGRVLYYLPDEDHGHLKPSVYVPFFGRPTATLEGAGRLLALAKVPVLPALTWFDADRHQYVTEIFPAVAFGDDVDENCALVRNEIEKLIRLKPDDYLWTLRMFNNQPDGSANPEYPPPKIAVTEENRRPPPRRRRPR